MFGIQFIQNISSTHVVNRWLIHHQPKNATMCQPFINPHMVIRRVKVPPRPIFWTPFLNRMELTGTLPWLFLNMVWLQNDSYLATLPSPGKSKWRPQSRDFVCFSILTTYKLHISAPIADSNAIVTATPIFGVQQLNDTIVYCTWHEGSPEIQDGGLQTRSTYISA